MHAMMPKTATTKEIQRGYKKFFDEVNTTRTPIFILNRNKQYVVILDPQTYEDMLKKQEEYETADALGAIRIYKEEKKAGKLKEIKSLKDLM